jgi:hypothetical protein
LNPYFSSELETSNNYHILTYIYIIIILEFQIDNSPLDLMLDSSFFGKNAPSFTPWRCKGHAAPGDAVCNGTATETKSCDCLAAKAAEHGWVEGASEETRMDKN